MVLLLGGRAACLGGAAAAAALREVEPVLTLTEQDNNRRVPVQVGDLIEVHLAENATAGYRWETEGLDTKLLAFAEATASYPGGAVGSGGEAIFRFRVVGAGSGTLALKYWRHWEGPGSVIKTFAVTFDAAR